MPESIFRQTVLTEWEKNPWYTTDEAAVYIGLSVKSKWAVGKYVKKGWIKGLRQLGAGGLGQWVFHRSNLDAFLLNDPRPDHRKEATLTTALRSQLGRAEEHAWRALARNHLQQFGHWAGVWQQLNNIGYRRPSPFGQLVDIAREKTKKGGELYGHM